MLLQMLCVLRAMAQFPTEKIKVLIMSILWLVLYKYFSHLRRLNYDKVNEPIQPALTSGAVSN